MCIRDRSRLAFAYFSYEVPALPNALMTSMPSMYSTMVLFICALDSSYWVKLFPLIIMVRVINTMERGTVTREASAILQSSVNKAIKLITGSRICPLPSGTVSYTHLDVYKRQE